MSLKNIMTWLLKTIPKISCEQFHVGTTFFLHSYTRKPYDRAKGSVYLRTRGFLNCLTKRLSREDHNSCFPQVFHTH